MEKAIPVFWKHGFSGTSVQDLEKATSVNKSGLYSEFKDKEDLFLSALKHYVAKAPVDEVLYKEPLGWSNIENFMNIGQTCDRQRGCFIANSLRELGDLPATAKTIIAEHTKRVKAALVANLKAAGTKSPAESVADLIFTFHSGMSVQQNYGISAAVASERIQNFLKLIRG
jgi:AcrR family transcriptional regulator